MNDYQLLNQISTLPEELKKEVADFVEFLQKKAHSHEQIKERQFGYAKDFFQMSDDFDEPLDDFNEYMQ
ncbi:MAG: DUF2281 domain-containing protein [Calditrichia bacterium]